MTSSSIKNIILEIHDFTLDNFSIPELSVSSGEWIHLINLTEEQSDELCEALTLRREGLAKAYFDKNYNGNTLKEKQAIRRRISYWSEGLEDITDEKFVKAKEGSTGFDRSSIPQSIRLFLDHLMIGDELPQKYKRLIYSLLMNVPELLIIHNALDQFDEHILNSLLKILHRYTQKSGLAIINMTNSAQVTEIFEGRKFTVANGLLTEIVID